MQHKEKNVEKKLQEHISLYFLGIGPFSTSERHKVHGGDKVALVNHVL